jgi:hypothetical protein
MLAGAITLPYQQDLVEIDGKLRPKNQLKGYLCKLPDPVRFRHSSVDMEVVQKCSASNARAFLVVGVVVGGKRPTAITIDLSEILYLLNRLSVLLREPSFHGG